MEIKDKGLRELKEINDKMEKEQNSWCKHFPQCKGVREHLLTMGSFKKDPVDIRDFDAAYFEAYKKYLLRKEEKYGNSWEIMPLSVLRDRLLEEVEEWKEAVADSKSGIVAEKDELFDIVNFGLMLISRLQGVESSKKFKVGTAGKEFNRLVKEADIDFSLLDVHDCEADEVDQLMRVNDDK